MNIDHGLSTKARAFGGRRVTRTYSLSLLSISLDRREETRGLLLLPSVAPRPKPEKCLTLDT